MKFSVYFEDQFLKPFLTRAEAETYRTEQIEKEGWDDEDHASYAATYTIKEEQ